MRKTETNERLVWRECWRLMIMTGQNHFPPRKIKIKKVVIVAQFRLEQYLLEKRFDTAMLPILSRQDPMAKRLMEEAI